MKRNAIIAIMLFTCGTNVFGATINVPADQPTIQACIDAALPGDECVVAPGTYNELINFNGKAITLRSSDGATVTTIDGTGLSGSVVTCSSGEGLNTVLEDFTITGGTGSVCFNSQTCGGGMFNEGASPTITNCLFSGNSATRKGGGMYNVNASAPTLTDCTFSVNTSAVDGGGMYNADGSTPTLINCIFSGNAVGGGGRGGGMHNNNSCPTVTNCTFSGNSSGTDGGGMLNLNNSSPTLTDCTFAGNSAVFGGGINNWVSSSPTLTDCTFSGNTSAFDGGGIFNFNESSPTVTDCTFTGNSAGQGGGGIANDTLCSPMVTNTTFSGNSAHEGGGMFNLLGSNPTVADCTFSENSTTGVNGSGGGMWNCCGGTSPTVINCMFSGNSAWDGGGMYNSQGSPNVTNCTFSGNLVGESGGGMFNVSSDPMVTNCTFSGNSAMDNGGGMHNKGSSSPTVTNCAFSGNSAGNNGGGMYNRQGSSPVVTNCAFSQNFAVISGSGVFSTDEFGTGHSASAMANCILWGNAPEQIVDAFGAVTTVSYSNVQGSWPGMGNINAEPLMVDAVGADGIPGTGDDDLRLLLGSPCIDAANNAAVPADAADLDGDGDTLEPLPFDLDGNERFVDDPATPDCPLGGCGTAPIVDMGAFEFQGLTDCNGNGVDDSDDIAGGFSIDCDLNGVPDECDFDCNADGIPDACDADCQSNGLSDLCEILAGASDCNANDIPDDCELDCNSDGVIDVCDQDCQSNGTSDLCEILGGAPDCNLDSTPDECQLINNDCNGNLTPDDCDSDCAESGLPDDCQAPLAVASGSRYLTITPQPGCSTIPVAIKITSPDFPCLSKFVSLSGGWGVLVDFPLLLMPSEWGTVQLSEAAIVPGAQYHVQIDNGTTLSQPVNVTTSVFGDVDGNGVPNFADIQMIVTCFQGNNGLLTVADIAGCTPNHTCNFEDIQWGVFAFQAVPFEELCPLPCN